MDITKAKPLIYEPDRVLSFSLGALALSGVLFLYPHLSPFFLVTGVVGFLGAATPFRNPLLILLGLFHAALILVGGGLASLWRHLGDVGLLLVGYVGISLVTVQFLIRLPRNTRLKVFLICMSLLAIWGLSGEELPFRLRFLLSLAVWPLALLLTTKEEELRNLPWWAPVMTFIPSWHVQFFHNIPTEPSPAAFFSSQPTRDEITDCQKEGVRLLGWTLGFVLIKALFDWLVWGRAPFGLSLLQFSAPWAPWNLVHWNEFANPAEPLWKKVVTVYACFSSFLLHFIILGTLVNALARVWGFRFPLNVKFGMGLRVVTQWNTFFYYLNNVIVKVFYLPLLNSLCFVRHRRLRSSLALVLAIYLFGYAYLLFLFQDLMFEGNRWKFLFEYRGYYLALVCLLGLARIWGPKTKRRTWMYRAAPYFYFLVMAPLLMFGVLSLDSNFFQF